MTQLTEQRIYEFGDFSLDITRNRLYKNGKRINLTRKSTKILLLLIQNRIRVISKEEIIEECWEEKNVEESTLIQHIYRIRTALTDKDNKYIETIPTVGYQFVADATIKIAVLETSDGKVETDDFLAKEENLETKPSETTEVDFQRETFQQVGPDYLKDLNRDHRREENLFDKKEQFGINKKLISAAAGFLTLILCLAVYLNYLNEKATNNFENIKSVAVLPFKQIGTQKVDERLEVGLGGALISELSNQKDFSVSPFTTTIYFDEHFGDNLTKIGSQLKVDAVLTGTVQQEHGIIKVDVQLIDIKTNSLVWSDRFSTEFSSIFGVQDNISKQIVKNFPLIKTRLPKTASEIEYAENMGVEELYSIALTNWEKRTPEGLVKARNYLEIASDKDKNSPKIYALLADTYSLIGLYAENFMPKNEAFNKAENLVDKALELKPNFSEAIATKALIKTQRNEPAEAEKLFLKAIDLNPTNMFANLRLARFYADQGKLKEILNHLRKAQKVNPRDETLNANLVMYLLIAGQTDEALEISQEFLKYGKTSNNMKILLAQTFEQKKNYREAQKYLDIVLKEEPGNRLALMIKGRISAKLGEKTKADEILNALANEDSEKTPNYNTALIYIQLGEEKKALQELNQIQTSGHNLILLENDRNLDPLRSSSEFKKIVERITIKNQKSV
jgi:DNA-binding winged helix-turn-helix (wHTH) protein/TolB-like protein/Tfp pilus assembly protein PilF